MKDKVLVLASVASMIQQFNMPNIKLFIEMGFEVHVACNFIDGGTIPSERVLELKNELSSLNVRCIQIDFDRNALNILSSVKATSQVRKLIGEEKYVFVHAHSPIGGVASRLSCIGRNTKVVYTAHGFHFFKGASKKNWLLYYPIEKILSRFTDILITINEEDYNLASKKFKTPKVYKLHGVGVDGSKFSPIETVEKNIIRNKHYFDEKDFIMVTVGELNENKNQMLLLELFNSKMKNEKHTKLILIGTGPLENKLKKYVKDNQLDKNISILGYRKDVVDFLKISDIVISLSHREGLPVNLIEASLLGIPIVASNIRGNKDIVIDGKNGFLFDLNDSEKLLSNIESIKSSSTIRNEMSRESIKYSKKYRTEAIMHITQEIYSSISNK